MFWQIKGANIVTSHNLQPLTNRGYCKSSFTPECLTSLACNEAMP